MAFLAVLLFIWAGLAAGYGVIVLDSAKSAVHEIQAGIAFLIATVSIGSCFIIIAVDYLRTRIVKTLEGQAGPNPEGEDATPKYWTDPTTGKRI